MILINKASHASACTRTRLGCFFTMSEYYKAPTDIDEQILLLSRRGLIIDSEKDLKEWLECVSYYRLRGYTHPFQEPNDDHRRSSLV